jgi:FG-GAP-like repeat
MQMNIRNLVFLLLWLTLARIAFADQGLEKLKYNHPGLVVDLGVGLWAWPVPCDADGDGDFDLIVSCPDKPSNGVWLFENPNNPGDQSNWPIFKPARKLSGTVHYVMPSYFGGSMRVLSPGFEYPEFTRLGLEKKAALPIEPKFYVPTGKEPKGPKVRHNQWRYVDFDGDDKLDVVVGIEDWSYYGWDDAWDATGQWTHGPLHGFVFVFRNQASNEQPSYAPPLRLNAFDKDGNVKPIDTFGCPSPNFEDFDNDGDLDLICGEFLDGFTYFENIGTPAEPKYQAGKQLHASDGRPLKMELQMIVPVAFDWDRDGDKDLIVGDEDGRVALVENTGKLYADRRPSFHPPRYFQQQADTLKCGALATPVGTDWDADGDVDIVSGNTAGYIEFFENMSGRGVDQPKWNAPKRMEVDGRPFRVMAGANGSIQGPAEAKWGYTTFSVADWDHDGLPDIILNSILGDVVWLKNTGSKHHPMLSSPHPIEVQWKGDQPSLAWGWRKPSGKALLTQWRTTPVVFDFNQDGLNDLAMLDVEGYLSYFERFKESGNLQLQSPRRAFVDATGQPLRLNAKSAGGSGRRKLCVTDWDVDGRFDWLLNSSNADFLRQTKESDGKWYFENAGTLAKQNIEGHDVSPSVVDFEQDGIPDFLGGAEDGRFYYLRNTHSNPKP